METGDWLARKKTGLSADDSCTAGAHRRRLDSDLPATGAEQSRNEVWLAPESALRVILPGGDPVVPPGATRRSPLDSPAEARYRSSGPWSRWGLSTEVARPPRCPARSCRGRGLTWLRPSAGGPSELAEILPVARRGRPFRATGGSKTWRCCTCYRSTGEDQAARAAALAFVDGGMLADVASFIRGAWGRLTRRGRGSFTAIRISKRTVNDGGHVTALDRPRRSRLELGRGTSAFCSPSGAFPGVASGRGLRGSGVRCRLRAGCALANAAYPRWFAHPGWRSRLRRAWPVPPPRRPGRTTRRTTCRRADPCDRPQPPPCPAEPELGRRRPQGTGLRAWPRGHWRCEHQRTTDAHEPGLKERAVLAGFPRSPGWRIPRRVGASADTAGAEVVGRVRQRRESVHPGNSPQQGQESEETKAAAEEAKAKAADLRRGAEPGAGSATWRKRSSCGSSIAPS